MELSSILPSKVGRLLRLERPRIARKIWIQAGFRKHTFGIAA
jgi:hypothetical protein